jgi:tagatose 6-phosphate kinase
MASDVIVIVTLNPALHVSHAAGDPAPDGVRPIQRPSYRAGGRGATAARVLRAFGHDVLAAGLAGGVSGELIRDDLARSGVPAAFTLIGGESRRVFRFTGGGQDLRFGEPGPYITTEELGRLAADYRSLLAGAAAVVLCGSLPDGLPAEVYGTLVTYAVEAEVPVILDAGGEELRHAVSHGPDLVVAETSTADPDLGAALIRLGAGAAAVATGYLVRAVTAAGEWTARVTPAAGDPPPRAVRGALVAGLVPGQLLGWSWPDRLRHALALALAADGLAETGERSAAPTTISTSAVRDHIDLAAYERLLDAVTVERSP